MVGSDPGFLLGRRRWQTKRGRERERASERERTREEMRRRGRAWVRWQHVPWACCLGGPLGCR